MNENIKNIWLKFRVLQLPLFNLLGPEGMKSKNFQTFKVEED